MIVICNRNNESDCRHDFTGSVVMCKKTYFLDFPEFFLIWNFADLR